MPFIDFSVCKVPSECYICSSIGTKCYNRYYRNRKCCCILTSTLNRIRIDVNEQIDKNTNYEISIEKDRKILTSSFTNKLEIPIDENEQFNMQCNVELNADDETTIFEPHVLFFETFFNVKHLIDNLQLQINFDKKINKGKSCDKEIYTKSINNIKQTFMENAMKMCICESQKHKKVAEMLMNKIIHIILLIKIQSLFDDDKKPNAHMTKREKQ
ncbi:MAG: hypothetical protein Edafosvirus1_61 [Edafosvirus sp.]|uniref:Uncharacterized protein n=1 Tax=Edafosvirus sp. TaxID=2487765 RepID=A0A3G4ZS53_9VIRU|nr:MAG: hypothetical protein Edafosvirus1_61 [Edafosvirus sp.]